MSHMLLVSSILLVVVSGVSYSYFNNPIIIYSPKIPYKILFGIGIGTGIISFIGFVLFLLFPSLKCNFFVTFPLFFITIACYFYLSYPSSSTDFLKSWNDIWNPSFETESFQTMLKCCGWLNSTDRPIPYCPMDYESGCAEIIRNYLDPRFDEIFISTIVVAVLGLISTISLGAICCTSKEPRLLTELAIFN